jgi:hypothetical protein
VATCDRWSEDVFSAHINHEVIISTISLAWSLLYDTEGLELSVETQPRQKIGARILLGTSPSIIIGDEDTPMS